MSLGFKLLGGECVDEETCDREGVGAYSEWSNWSECSKDCGGVQHRVSHCIGPAACEKLIQTEHRSDIPAHKTYGNNFLKFFEYYQ